jgi:hypothetical protein
MLIAALFAADAGAERIPVGLTFDPEVYRTPDAKRAGDNFCNTWAADDSLYVTVDDGNGWSAVSGIATEWNNRVWRLKGGPRDYTPEYLPGFPDFAMNRNWYGFGIVSVDGVLYYAISRPYAPDKRGIRLLYSPDLGKSWFRHDGTDAAADRYAEDAASMFFWNEQRLTLKFADDAPAADAIHRLPPLDPARLDAVYTEDYKVEPLADEKNGVFIDVLERQQDGPSLGWGGRSNVVTEAGVRWFIQETRRPDRKVTTRLRLKMETVRYLITMAEAPLEARCAAVTAVSRLAELPPACRLALIEIASRDARAQVRMRAVDTAADHAPLADAIPLLCRALRDPCGKVAAAARPPIERYFFPSESSVHDVEVFSVVGGREVLDRFMHNASLHVARRVHDVRPDLVTAEDLAVIEALAKPDEAPAAETLRRLPPLDPRGFETEFTAKEVREVADQEHGVLVDVPDAKPESLTGEAWRSNVVVEVEGEPGVPWFQTIWEGLRLRIRLAPETMRYLVQTPDAPHRARWIALREIHRVEGLDDDERLRLVEVASRDRNMSIRRMAILAAGRYEPVSRAIPLLCRSLCDPSADVAVEAALRFEVGSLPAEFAAIAESGPDGKPPPVRIYAYSGPPDKVAWQQYGQVLAVAERMHAVRPDLVTEEDLATITRLREKHIEALQRERMGGTDPGTGVPPAAQP